MTTVRSGEYQQLVAILHNSYEVSVSEDALAATPLVELGLDSLSLVAFLIDLEDVVGGRLPADAAETETTIGHLVEAAAGGAR